MTKSKTIKDTKEEVKEKIPEVSEEVKPDNNIRKEQFTKFYELLKQNAPEGYTPWIFPCEKNGKNPSSEAILKLDKSSKGSWKHPSACLTKGEAIRHIEEGYNLGISARAGDCLIIGDIDNPEFLSQIPKNTLTTISRKRIGGHFFGLDKDGTAKVNLTTDDGEIRSYNQYVIAPGSYVPFDLTNIRDKESFESLPEKAKIDSLLGYYTINTELPLRELTYEDLPQFFKDYHKKEVEAQEKIDLNQPKREYIKFEGEGKYSELLNLKVSDIVGKISSEKRVGHPLHESETNANFSLSPNGVLGHCWRHLVSLNAVQFLCVKAGVCSCKEAGTPHKISGPQGEKISQGTSKIKGEKEALEIAYHEALKMGLIKEWIPPTDKKKNIQGGDIFTIRGQLERFYEKHPFYYDTSKIFYRWVDSRWVISDEVDFCNLIYETFGLDTTDTKKRTTLIEGLKQVGRKHKPKKFEKTWVQFQNDIYDVKNGKKFEASPEYFGLNPIPWRVGDSEATPIMDRLFLEWVGEDWIQTLYEVIAYCVTPDKFLQRLIALFGGGSNGKGTFIKLLCKFLGEDNYVSTELRELSENKFEPAVLYGKLLAIMGEVSSNDLRNTNQLKKLAGEDKISFQFKGKTPFTADNTATIICATNSLPITPDKTQGFYRKWLIIDFPNQFQQLKEDLISKIPAVEFENLTKKCIRILKNLYVNPVFTNQGSFEEREKRFEERSNPIKQFLERYCEESEDFVSLKEFGDAFNNYQRKQKQRIFTIRTIGKFLREDGFEVTPRKEGENSRRVILNLSLKTTRTTITTEKPYYFPYKEVTTTSGSFGSNSSNSKDSQLKINFEDDFENEEE